MDLTLLLDWTPHLLKGLGISALLALTTAPFGFGAGLAIAVLGRSPSSWLRGLCGLYTTVFRGLPELLSLFLIYYGLQLGVDWICKSAGLPRFEINAFAAGVVALAVVVAAYSSEVWVAALDSISRGQTEAGLALSLSRRTIFTKILLPQMLRVAIPSLGNIWTTLFKDTALISTIAVTDLMRASNDASKATSQPIMFFGCAAVIYLMVSLIGNLVQVFFERRSLMGAH